MKGRKKGGEAKMETGREKDREIKREGKKKIYYRYTESKTETGIDRLKQTALQANKTHQKSIYITMSKNKIEK